MPEISRFYGIIIYMYIGDHAPAHFHAQYNEFDVIIEIETGELYKGFMPSKQLKYIQVWADIHKEELMRNFIRLSVEKNGFDKIKPL